MVRFDQTNWLWLLLLLMLEWNFRTYRAYRMLSTNLHVTNGFWTNLVLLYSDVLTTGNRCDGLVYHRRLTLNWLLLVVHWHPTSTGDLNGLSLLLPEHTRLLLLGLARSKLHRALMDDFASTLHHSSVGDLVMARWNFAAVDDDLLRTLLIWLRWLIALFVDELGRMRLLALHLNRLTFVVGDQHLMRHSRRHGNISHRVEIGRNVDQKISTARRMMDR